MFVGRDQELAHLNRSYQSGVFQFPVIYGRRRVGKTTLINAFCADKKAIYFVAVQSTAKVNLEAFSAQILSALAPDAPKNPFSSFVDALEYVFTYARKERIILAIDEYPYLAESYPAISSILQAAVDKYQAESKLFLILCGSSMSFMETQVLGYQSPLYGRRTAQYKLSPFDYADSALMLGSFSLEDKILLYSATGGIPEYLSRIDPAQTAKENIQNLFFDPSGRLYEEPTNLLKQELRMPETYHAIIRAVAGGASRLHEIASKAGIETSQCSAMLSSLAGLGLIRKEHPVTLEKSKRPLYRLDDWMYIFWYRFVFPDLSRIGQGLGDIVCDEVFAGDLPAHVGQAFEECAKQYLWRASREKRLPFTFRHLGRWWGPNPKERRKEEIDFIAYEDEKAVFGECKWRNARTGHGELVDLTRKAALFSRFSDVRYALFAKSDFTGPLAAEAAARDDIYLFSLADMFP